VDGVSRTYPAGDLRVSDADRDAALAELSEHFQVGRLTADELDERTGRAISARTGKELADLLADLPAAPAVPVVPAGRRSGANRLTRHWAPVTAAVAAGGIAAVVVVVAILTHGHGYGHGYGPTHGHGGQASWGLILVGLLIYRVTRRGRRSSRRSE
jgi:hypothetical protein